MTADGSVFRLWAFRIALALPAVFVAVMAIPRLASGIALNAAFPTTAYMVINVPMPLQTYVRAAKLLARAPQADGDTRLLAAEAAMRAGLPADKILPIARRGLVHAPANARGWIILADLLGDKDSKKAAAAVALSLELAPREYYLVVPRVIAAAPVWKDLPKDTLQSVLSDTRRIIRARHYHSALLRLLATKGGPGLVTRALAGHPDELRKLNRAIVRERLGLR